MSFDIAVERRNGIAVLRAMGEGDGIALLRSLGLELERSAAAGDTRLLVDLTAAAASGPSRHEIADFEVGAARREARRGPGTRVAVVVSADLHFGLARMFQMLRAGSPVEYGVFRSGAEGERWLGVGDDDGGADAAQGIAK